MCTSIKTTCLHSLPGLVHGLSSDPLRRDPQNELIEGLYSSSFEARGSAFGAGDPYDLTDSAAGGMVLQGPVRIAQLRSKTYDCSDEMPSIMASSGYPYICTYNRRLTYSNYAFDEATEATDAFRGFAYDNALDEPVDVQRNERMYTSYETFFRHQFPAPAFAVLVDTHKARSAAQAAVDGLVSGRYVDRQTNAIFIDLSIYNYLLDNTMWVRLTAEFNTAGGVLTAYEAIPAQLFWRPDGQAYQLTLTVLVSLGYLYFASILAFSFWAEGPREVLQRPMTYIQIINVAFFIINVLFQYQSYCLCAGGFLSSHHIGNVNYLSESFLDFRAPVRAQR